MFDACSDCPVRDGACYARRSNIPRLCALPQYRPMLAEFGATGGPGGSHGTPLVAPPLPSAPPYESPPYSSRDAFLAPIRFNADGSPVPWHTRPWEGVAPKKPWHYPIVAGICHLDQPDMLEVVIETLRAQTVRPFIHIVDTGSNAAVRKRLEAIELSCDDVQIDYLNPRAWQQTSVPVAVAMDHIFSSAPVGVDYVYSTHVDVFLKSREYLAYLMARCDAQTPVVGYQMSDRGPSVCPTAHEGAKLWPIIPSHTASLYHMPTMRRINASWSMVKAAQRLGIGAADYGSMSGWPDTEVNLGLDLRDAGIGMRWLAEDGSDPGKPGPVRIKPSGTVADCGHDVWVGPYTACDADLSAYDLSVHFHYPNHSGPECSRIKNGGPGIAVAYCDGDPLSTLSVPLGELAAYCAQPGRLLIHCAAGLCRSPTLALVALVARGCDPYDAIRDVAKAVRLAYGGIVRLHYEPLQDFLVWAETYKPTSPPVPSASWLCIGTEPNAPYETPWLSHVRSFTSHVLYNPAVAESRRGLLDVAMTEARARIAKWKAPAKRVIDRTKPKLALGTKFDISKCIPCGKKS